MEGFSIFLIVIGIALRLDGQTAYDASHISIVAWDAFKYRNMVKCGYFLQNYFDCFKKKFAFIRPYIYCKILVYPHIFKKK